MENYFFSLITGTIGRRDELERLLESLHIQTFKDFELIIIDQNDNSCIDDIIEKYNDDFNIIHLHAEKGLSQARNKALKQCNGKWCAFPDDDCYYSHDLMANVVSYIASNSDWDGISTMVTDDKGKFSAGGYMSAKSQRVSAKNVWRCAVSPSLFIKREAIKDVNGFNEELGVGAGTKWGSGEESDIVLRITEKGYHIEYIPALKVFHPRFSGPWTMKTVKRGFLYGCGMGYVLKKHRYSITKTFWFASIQLVKGLAYLSIFHWQRSRFHLAMSSGRLYGYFKTKKL
jgi:glycosyltransferase involved in cell wall biosynthesis